MIQLGVAFGPVSLVAWSVCPSFQVGLEGGVVLAPGPMGLPLGRFETFGECQRDDPELLV